MALARLGDAHVELLLGLASGEELVEPLMEARLPIARLRTIGEPERPRVAVLQPRVAQQAQRVVLRVAVAPVGGDHVVACAYAGEEIFVDVPDAAVVWELEDVDDQWLGIGQQPFGLEAGDDGIGTGVAGEQQRPLARARWWRGR